VAIQCAFFDPCSHEIRIASAGMPGPVHLSASGCRTLELSGIPPGLFAESNYDTFAVRLKPGDSMLFCTDGLTDAFNCHGEQFGLERLHLLCSAERLASPTEILSTIFAAVENFSHGCEQHDDMAATLFHFSG
jgi:sigma-B regulation protein RsbU (phosphoserine phosphatase)